MRMLADDDDDIATTSTSTKSQTSQQPAWMRSLLERCREWLKLVPSVGFRQFILPCKILIRTPPGVQSPPSSII